MTFRIAPQDMDAFMSGQRQYWRQVNESEGFDIDHIEMPLGTTGLRAYDCEDDGLFYPHAVIVERYARFGLHRYNMSHGTHFQLNHLKKFSMTMNCLASYYITLAACDPTTRSTLNFQVKVDEHSHARLKLTCSIARLQGTPREPLQPHGRAPVDVLLVWPTDFNDTNRFHEIEESELESNDWIRLYLELALCTDDDYISESELSQLRIIKVAIETTEANVTDVYIKFKGLALASISEDGVHVERKVIVRRIINEDTGYVSLLGGYGFSIGEVVTARRDLTRTRPRPRPRPHVPGEDRPPERSFCNMMNRLAQRRASPFGGTTQQSQPAFGNSNTPAFGSSNTPAFGASSTPAFGFGATSTPGFGASSTSSFGSANTPAFGASSTPSFGTSSSPAFGASPTPAFGSSGSTFGNNAFGSGGAFGASSTSAFGASSSPSFNLGSSPAFGQCTSAFGSSTFCSTQSSFGSQGSNSMFGGQSTIGGQQEGSRVMPYAPTTEATDSANGIQPTSKLQSISAMPVYKEKCQEELRWEDYQRGDKGGKLPAGQSPGGAGFGVTNSQPSLFSVSPTNQANPFSSVVTNNFPPTIAPKNSSPFGQTPPNPSNLFGQNPPTPSMFGSSSGFATITTQPFGSAPSQGQGSTPPFCIGGNFNNSQSAPLFNSNPSLGLNGSAFGQNTKPGFAQTNTFSTPSTGFAITFSTSFDGI